MTGVSRVAACAALAAVLAVPARASAQADEARRVQDSIEVLQSLVTAPDQGIPQKLLDGAEAIVVIPSLIKGGFVIGGKHGLGVISVRDRRTNTWSAPVFVKMTGGSIGWQIGVESIDLTLLVMNHDAIDNLLKDKFTLGGNLSVAAGPVGRSGDAATDAEVSAQILAYSRAKGLFAGATLEGAALHADDDANRAFYGTKIALTDLLTPASTPKITIPSAAANWREALARMTKASIGPETRR